MKSKNSIISTLGFGMSAGASMILFAGLFSAKWDYIIENLFDTLFVLVLGFLVPVFFIIGIIFFVKSFHPQREQLFALPLVVGVLSIFITLVYYCMTTFSSFIELFTIKLGIK